MNEIDPARRFSMDAVRKFEAPPEADKPGGMNDVARQVASQYRRDTMSPIMVSGVLRMVEFALLFLSGLCVYFYFVGFFNYLAWEYPLTIAAASFLAVVLLDVTDCYQVVSLMRPIANFGRILLVWAGTFALMALTAFAMKMSGDYSRLLFGTWFVAGFVLIFSLRLVMSKLIRSWARDGRMERRAVIVGGGKAAEVLIRSVEKQPYNDIRICGIFDDRSDKRSPPIVAGYPKLGTISELIEFARIARIDMLIVSLPLTAESRVLQLLKKLWVLPVDIRLSAHSNALQFRPRAYSYIGSVPMLDIFDKPINDWDSVAKRAFDIVFSIIGIIVFSPVMLATAIAIKLDSKGPVLFHQKRHGFNNEIIEVYKFRSMYTDKADPTAKQTVTKNDPRVTRVGRFIRKTSIDELPQFFNSLLARCRWSARARTPSPPNRTIFSTMRWSTVISPATRSSPVSLAGHRSMAGAARWTPTRRSGCGRNTTSSTSRTGRCCSI